MTEENIYLNKDIVARKEFSDDLNRMDEHFLNPDKAITCRRCNDIWTPAPDAWIFYNLCDTCFVLFDAQKMRGRFSMFGLTPRDEQPAYFESSTEWIKTYPFVSKEEDEKSNPYNPSTLLITSLEAIFNKQNND